MSKASTKIKLSVYIPINDEESEEYILEIDATATIEHDYFYGADADGNRGRHVSFAEDINWEYPESFECGKKFDRKAKYFDEYGNEINLKKLIDKKLESAEWDED